MNLNFTQELNFSPKVFQTRDGKEVYLQWFNFRIFFFFLSWKKLFFLIFLIFLLFRGLENTLTFQRFKVDGNIRSIDDQIILNDFFSNNDIRNILQLNGSIEYPLIINSTECQTTIRSMSFFDTLLSSGKLSIKKRNFKNLK